MENLILYFLRGKTACRHIFAQDPPVEDKKGYNRMKSHAATADPAAEAQEEITQWISCRCN
jgi:hypothetical protein